MNGALKVPLVAAGDTTAGAVMAVQNEDDRDRIVTNLIIDVITPSDGVATIDAGMSGETLANGNHLIDGLDVNAAAGVFSNHSDPGSQGASQYKWSAGLYITITASADLAGFEGNAYLQWFYP
jgi:hypothetical protein